MDRTTEHGLLTRQRSDKGHVGHGGPGVKHGGGAVVNGNSDKYYCD